MTNFPMKEFNQRQKEVENDQQYFSMKEINQQHFILRRNLINFTKPQPEILKETLKSPCLFPN